VIQSPGVDVERWIKCIKREQNSGGMCSLSNWSSTSLNQARVRVSKRIGLGCQICVRGK